MIDFPVYQEDAVGCNDGTGYETQEGEPLLREVEIVDAREDKRGSYHEGVQQGKLEACVHADETNCGFGEEHVDGTDDGGAEEILDGLGHGL